MIEELGYRRKDVETLKPEIASRIVAKGLKRPIDGVPADWCIVEESIDNKMLEKLQNESRYPLKTPLLGISLILFGKGFFDGLITIIKVNTNFPGVSFLDEFMGVPVLAIDFVCVAAGITLGSWTWNTMK